MDVPFVDSALRNQFKQLALSFLPGCAMCGSKFSRLQEERVLYFGSLSEVLWLCKITLLTPS